MVQARGGKISFDPNIRKELMERDSTMRGRIGAVYAMTDLLLPGSDELPLLTGESDMEKSLEKIFAGTGVAEVVVKMGSKGCMYADRTERFTVEPFSVTEVDPTGAGDCFGGAFVAARLAGRPAREATILAAAAGALAVTKKGPMEGASFLDAVEAFAAPRLK
jgi:sugar/nucleoside kinase (ribokinase family)